MPWSLTYCEKNPMTKRTLTKRNSKEPEETFKFESDSLNSSRAEKRPELLVETSDYLAFSKPAGWMTISGVVDLHPVLLDWAKPIFGPLWTVHRLDVGTSGVILFARSSEAHQKIKSWFQNRKLQKRYVFLESGEPGLPVFRVNDPVGGKPSTTQIEVLESFSGGFLGAAVPVTGRKHQIRIHLAQSQHPIFGDKQYGGAMIWPNPIGTENLAFPRVALHSQRIKLPDGQLIEAPLPKDFTHWLNVFRGISSE